MALSNIALTLATWIDCSSLVQNRRVFVSGGEIDLYAAPTNADTFSVFVGRVRDGETITGDDLGAYLKAVIVRGTPVAVCSGDTTGRSVSGPATLAVGVAPAWGAVCDRGSSGGNTINIFGPEFVEVEQSPDNAKWAPCAGTNESGFGRVEVAQRYLRARSVRGGSARVMSADESPAGGPPSGAAGGILSGTYPDPGGLVSNDTSAIPGQTALVLSNPAGAESDPVVFAGAHAVGGNPFVITSETPPSTENGRPIIVQGADGNASDGSSVSVIGGRGEAGGALVLQGGQAEGAATNGANVYIDAGAGTADAGEIIVGSNFDGGQTRRLDVQAAATFQGSITEIASTMFATPASPTQNIPNNVTNIVPQTLAQLNNTSGGALVMASTPTINAPSDPTQDGVRITLVNQSANAITLRDISAFAGSNLRNRGGANVVLAQYDTVSYVRVGTVWHQL